MAFEGSSFELRLTMPQVGAQSFPVDLLLADQKLRPSVMTGAIRSFVRHLITARYSMAELKKALLAEQIE